jgi:hypothetical protein
LALEEQDNQMGLTQIVRFPTSHAPGWPAVRDLLAAHQCVLQIRMIDGELAFPDEEPGENWRELRLATQEGLALTVKRETARAELIIWGNADRTLIRAWNALTWAFAETGQGIICTESGEQTPSEYLNHADVPWKPCGSG